MTIRKFGTGLLFAAAIWMSPGVSAAQTTYTVDPVHSTMIFKIDHLGISDFYGRFNDVGGSLVIDPDPSKSKVNVEVKVDSADTNQPKRDEHLKGPDFFNSKQFPKITFESTSIKKTGEGKFDVAGNLTIKGTAKPVTLHVVGGKEVVDPSGKTRIGFNTEITLKRSEYGVNFMPDKLGDDVTLLVSVEGVKEAAK